MPRPARVVIRHVVLPDGHLMTVARFTGTIKVVLHCGSADPGSSCRGLPGPPRIPPASRPRLLAAFNGGFLLSTGTGGYEQAGRVISPLRRGRASLVIYRSAAASIGTWGHSVPEPGRQVYSVRQNLSLLVRNGHPTAAALGAWVYWGATLGGGELVARSALGENASGQLIYVASMSASPADLATALVRFGARSAMELDINPEWVQLAYANKAGRPLHAGVTGQARPADQYLTGWTRDFIAIMARGQPAPG
jgi:phosphodiester glycosidase